MPEHTYKLYYYNIRGAAEALRLVFALADVEYEDVRIEQADWPNRQDEMPQKNIPCLEIDGTKYVQSYALFRFLGREYDLYGETNLDALVIDEVGETFVDMNKGIFGLITEPDEEKRKAGMQKIIDDTFPKYVPHICKRLNDNTQSGYLVGKTLTIGDIIIYRNMGFLKDFFGGQLSDYDPCWGNPELQKHYDLVESNEKIKAWIAKRPVTQY